VKTSVFDLFKISIGPSSSHTIGPMRATREFALALPEHTARIKAELYGSLALTGKGHATDRAILLRLAGETSAGIDPDKIEEKLQAFRESGIPSDVVFHKDMVVPRQNAIRVQSDHVFSFGRH
jgi:L-serine dehydratase